MTRFLPSGALALAALGLCAACGDALEEGERSTGATPAPSVVVEDSAGVQIVRVVEGSETERWTLDPDPDVVVGEEEGSAPYLLARPEFAGRLEDGGLVVADWGSGQLRWFDADGEFVHSLGSRGQGPGEFQEFNRVVLLPGDTLVVYDFRNQRATRIDPWGSAVRTTPLTGLFAFDPQERFRPWERNEFRVTGVAPDRSLARWRNLHFAGPVAGGGHVILMRQWAIAPGPPSSQNDTLRGRMAVMILDEQGGTSGHWDEGPGPLQFGRWEDRGRGLSPLFLDVPFHTETVLAAAGDGFVVSETGRYELRLHDARGALQRVIRRDDREPRLVTDAEMDRFVHWRTVEWPGVPDEEASRWFHSFMGGAQTLPTHGDVYVDPHGRIWVADYRPPWDFYESHAYTFSVFDPDGTLVARLDVPAGFDVTHVGTDHLTGVVRDVLGVERVHVYRIVRP